MAILSTMATVFNSMRTHLALTLNPILKFLLTADFVFNMVGMGLPLLVSLSAPLTGTDGSPTVYSETHQLLTELSVTPTSLLLLLSTYAIPHPGT